MLCWVLVFLGTAIIASLRGLGGLASTAAGIAEVLFFVFLVTFMIALVMGSVRHRAVAYDPTSDSVDAEPTAGDSPISVRRPRAAPDDPRHAL
jgi:uncharacterized membrane protein YtjA (UPF0391 family)